jgi:peptidyl-prolyl cis-trans isomerase A (cyclophilin A)
MNTVFLSLAAFFLLQAAPAKRPAQAPAARPAAPAASTPAAPAREPGLYATLTTSMGTIVCKLYEKEAPVTVENFVGLARGTKEWTDPRTKQKVKRPLYSGTIFHRVVPDFMIQGGDPLGTGYGDPGYAFKDEFSPGLVFDRPGLLAMANAGPGTNGSQFFITVAPTPFLNNKHTIFGEVVEGLNVVNAIVQAPRDPQNDRPRTPVTVNTIAIRRYPTAAPATKSTTGAAPGKAPAKTPAAAPAKAPAKAPSKAPAKQP